MAMTIQFGTYGWSAVSGGEFTLPSLLQGRVAEDRGLSDHESPLNFNDIGELINESEIVINGKGKGSAGLSIKGHHPEKDGIPACLLAAEAVTARGASLTGQSSLIGDYQ